MMNLGRGVFAIEREADDSHQRIKLRGEMDLASLSRFEAVIECACRTAATSVLLDVSDLTFLDLPGLRAIYQARDRVLANGQEFLFVPGPPRVQQLFGFAEAIAEIGPLADATAERPRFADARQQAQRASDGAVG